MPANVRIERVEARAYRFPLDAPESDATLIWDHVPLVVVHARAGGEVGLGYCYAPAAAAALIDGVLAEVVVGRDALAVGACWRAMLERVRNIGRAGVAASAISAIDAALWDLAARLLGCPLAALLGQVRAEVPVYASGGFTSLTIDALTQQLGAWVEGGFGRVKMKVGREPEQDPKRVAAARAAIGRDNELLVDANGGYTRKQALAMAQRFAEHEVSWFEEPVSSDDLAGLRLLRDQGPPGVTIAAGEYGGDPWYFRRMLEAEAVDVIQVDATRALGVTGALRVDGLCQSHNVPISLHTAPAYHRHIGAALDSLIHVEWFHDHVRVEQALFDGAPQAQGGVMTIDPEVPGNGLRLRREEAERYAV